MGSRRFPRCSLSALRHQAKCSRLRCMHLGLTFFFSFPVLLRTIIKTKNQTEKQGDARKGTVCRQTFKHICPIFIWIVIYLTGKKKKKKNAASTEWSHVCAFSQCSISNERCVTSPLPLYIERDTAAIVSTQLHASHSSDKAADISIWTESLGIYIRAGQQEWRLHLAILMSHVGWTSVVEQ